ncbi:Nicotinate phosphoribosyltransferase [Penicillium subrubescens]|uniref:nicotinate phosphoribosyltransferase n=1 Tax=Penicillium subrubescens TaxID=1316194 RepID=A0A1Q5UQ45_9EURO|nr:Nicotinate phosphoribosyltransferase [Penicillium subrubescens]KAJ5890521.1 Nicotinate phosphoribosyltransferase [Penicillium subrubescens]OKP14591.1 Nicotinate phosphoribosyltransferase [Penicillium subrubescens]
MGQEATPLPEGIFSLLDTDLYKLTMQCAILKYFPDVYVTYGFTNRTPHMKLRRGAYKWLLEQMAKLANVRVTAEEHDFLKKKCPYLNETYLAFLETFQLRPAEQIDIKFTPTQDTGSDEDEGVVEYNIKGLWVDTILYEIPLLALTSQAYFMFSDKDWDHGNQEEKAFRKGCELLENGCVFSEFGSRRRRDYHTHDLVMKGLCRAAEEGKRQGWKGVLTGTSNVHFAMKYNVGTVGTVAHEWYMTIAAITEDYENANELALRYWLGCFGEGVLGIALTDTFGTPAFLDAFRKPIREAPVQSDASASPPVTTDIHVDNSKSTQTYAQVYTGVRQDSGDPTYFVKMVRDFYDREGITDKKTVVFSDSLNIEHCLEYKAIAEEAGFNPTFGVGTFFTNDFKNKSNGEKSKPLNIVIKIATANGRPAIKLSDNMGKNTGDSAKVQEVKQKLGYTEQSWLEGDEGNRWAGGRS